MCFTVKKMIGFRVMLGMRGLPSEERHKQNSVKNVSNCVVKQRPLAKRSCCDRKSIDVSEIIHAF